MSYRLKFLRHVLCLCATLACVSAQADVRLKRFCPSLPLGAFHGPNMEGKCYSGHTCMVGVRGDWLDLTDRVTVSGLPGAKIAIRKTGVEPTGSLSECIPISNKEREGYVYLDIHGFSGAGSLSVTMSRPAALGRDADTISVPVLKGETFLSRKNEGNRVAGLNVSTPLNFTGGDLHLLQLKNPVAGDAILSTSDTAASVRLTFARTGIYSLEDRLQFQGGEPPLNQAGGWPTVAVVANAPTPPPAPRTATPPKSGGPSTAPLGRTAPLGHTAPLGQPDLALTLLNIFRSSGPDFTNNEGSTYGLCPFGSESDPKVSTIPALTVRVQNLGSANVTGNFTVQVVRSGVTSNLPPVNGLAVGETKDLIIPRPENRVCGTKDLKNAAICHRCGNGIRGVPHWNDVGISVQVDSAGNVAESNENNNRLIVE